MQLGGALVGRVGDALERHHLAGVALKRGLGSGAMVALDRISNAPYQCGTSLHPISEVANLEKKVPLEWSTPTTPP